ncbi:MAG: FAD binding domain-containing protein [Acidimicrobiales bacterium]
MQVPAPVAYRRAQSVDDAISLLNECGPESRIIAGGHSLLPMMKLRLARPEYVIDINALSDLSYITIRGDRLHIGAMVRHAELLTSELVEREYAVITDAEHVIADPIVRNRGTVGGSICQADPAEDLSAVFAATDAAVTIRGTSGERTVSIHDFHEGPYMTVVEPAELVTEISVPLRQRCGSAYEKVERRVGDWAIAAAAGVIALDEVGRIAEAGIGLAAVGAPQYCARQAASSLQGQVPTPELFAQAGALASQECAPYSDQRGPEDYKRHLVEVLTTRALIRAYERAQQRS